MLSTISNLPKSSILSPKTGVMGDGPQRQPCAALPCFKPITCSCSFHTYRGSTKRNFPSRLWRDVNSSSSHSHSTSLVKLGRDTSPTPTKKNGLTAPPMGVSAVHFSFVASAPVRKSSALIGQKIKIQGAGQATVSLSVMFCFASFYCTGIHVSLQTSMNSNIVSNTRKFCGQNLEG